MSGDHPKIVRDVYRVSAMPPNKERLALSGINIDELGEKFPSIADAISNIDYTFHNPSISRFTDGTYPVLYTSEDPLTCRTEKGFWVCELLLKKKASPKKWIGQEYSVSIEGSVYNLAEPPLFDRELVNPDPNKYYQCWRFAKVAIASGAEIIKARSARKMEGTNYPIFVREAVKQSNAVGKLEYYIQEDKLNFETGAIKGQIEFDDVYGAL